MMNTKNLLIVVLFSVLFVGCENGQEKPTPGGMREKIRHLAVYNGCQDVCFVSGNSGVIDDGKFILCLYNHKGNTDLSKDRNYEVEELLAHNVQQHDIAEVYNVYVELINDAIEEFVVTADKMLFGKAPGEELNEHFYANLYNNYIVSHAESDIVLGSIDPLGWNEIDDVLGPQYMIPLAMRLMTKEVPSECAEYDYKEIVFTVSQRLASGKELTDSYTLVCTAK